MDGRILIITGERGVGKTTVCRKTVALARAAGLVCGGLLTLHAGGENQRHVVDIRTGDQRRLTTSTAGIRQGCYLFDPEVLAWGAGVLVHALPCDLLVVDELGPLEVERKQGWAVALDLFHSGWFGLALAVVRPELVADVQLRLPASAPTVVTVMPQNRDQLPAALLEMLEQEGLSNTRG
ncbi:MAG TPA: DUF2478 domain-containing protein [Chloroflexi bacterium]|nr:DUF2478 domain-containing protein [Chloroflexota bacterium]